MNSGNNTSNNLGGVPNGPPPPGTGPAASAADTLSDPAEISKFDAIAYRFWDPQGEFAPLHILNPIRTAWIAGRCSVPGARGLDVGCGGGLLCESLTGLGAHMIGIDLAPAMLQTARLHAAEQGLSIDYRQQSSDQLAREAPGSFDFVTCMEMLEHVPDPQAIVASLGQLVRPGGQIFISTINRNLKSFAAAIVAAEYLLRLAPRGTHEYERLMRPSELARLARGCGLTLVGMTGLAFDPFTRTAQLSSDPSVNYIAHFTRPIN